MIRRRDLLKLLAATGIGTATFHRAVAASGYQDQKLTRKSIEQAAWITEIDLSDDELDSILDSVSNLHRKIRRLRKIELDHSIGPAFHFQTLAHSETNPTINRDIKPLSAKLDKLPESDEEIAFLTVADLSHFIHAGQISSLRLTKLYLERLKKFGPMLRCVVNLTEELAIAQATRADAEIAAGKYKGPLHGVPWGAKDLISVPGYPTTWGIPHFQDRVIEEPATVYKRLENAGAVLVAKLSLGAIAMGDQWYEGRTRNPWNPRTGSSGSSAGSASATAAGMVGFSLGTETLGSITSPSRTCGANGFRPTFGRVSRHGCMPLSWTMDKVGPICRSVEDCAIVFAAIHGADQNDSTTQDISFDWPSEIETRGLKVGYAPGQKIEQRPELKLLNKLGCELIEVKIPSSVPIQTLANIIDIEAAAGFDELLRGRHTEGWNAWTRIFQSAQFVSAIDYIRMMRLRTKVMHEFEVFMSGVDFLFNVFDVYHTNLTGHPSIVVPHKYQKLQSSGARPVTVTITGHLNADARLLAFADAYQRQLDLGSERPQLELWLEKFESGELDKGVLQKKPPADVEAEKKDIE